MIRKVSLTIGLLIAILLIYFLFWPVPIDPVAWKAPPNPGYKGAFAPNEKLKGLEKLPLGGKHGPEDIALDSEGRIYAATHEGVIVRLKPDGTSPEDWADTGGRPLGMDFDASGNLIVADAYKGLLSIDKSGKVTLLTDEADGIPIRYADDVDVASDGKIYFSDASIKFGAKESGGTMEGSLLEIMEHGKNGRLLVYDPGKKSAEVLLKGISFANGVCVSHDQKYVLVNETGEYKVLRYWIDGEKKGQSDTFLEGLPGFPDNISTGMENRFWIAIVSPRNPLIDKYSESPSMRKILQRMPRFLRPKATKYGHIIAINTQGEVIMDLQDPNTDYPLNTSVKETKDYLYIGSLVTPELARVKKSKVRVQ